MPDRRHGGGEGGAEDCLFFTVEDPEFEVGLREGGEEGDGFLWVLSAL